MEYGPIHLVMIGFDANQRVEGAILRTLTAARNRGDVRLVDALIVSKDEVGRLLIHPGSDVSDDEAAQSGSVLRALLGSGVTRSCGAVTATSGAGWAGLAPGDARSVIAALEPGASALCLLFEQRWVASLIEAAREAGGFPLAQGSLPPEAELLIRAEQEAALTIEATRESRDANGTATRDAAIAMEPAGAMAELAAHNTEAVAAVPEIVRAQTAAEVVRALIAAGMIERSAVAEAADALVAAGFIEGPNSRMR